MLNSTYAPELSDAEVVERLFTVEIPRLLRKHPDRARKANTVLRVELGGPGAQTWRIDCTVFPPVIERTDAAATAGAGIISDLATFARLIRSGDTAAWLEAYRAGQIKLKGMATIARLRMLFSIRLPEDQLN